eukprot:1853939-Ditylum_brightwellii.AAC.1
MDVPNLPDCFGGQDRTENGVIEALHCHIFSHCVVLLEVEGNGNGFGGVKVWVLQFLGFPDWEYSLDHMSKKKVPIRRTAHAWCMAFNLVTQGELEVQRALCLGSPSHTPERSHKCLEHAQFVCSRKVLHVGVMEAHLCNKVTPLLPVTRVLLMGGSFQTLGLHTICASKEIHKCTINQAV